MAVTKLTNSGIKTGQLKYDSFLAGNPAFFPGSFDSIATVTVGASGVTEINFTSIPQTYTHLHMRSTFATDTGEDSPWMQFNGDTGANYSWHGFGAYGNGALTGSSSAPLSQIYTGYVTRVGQFGVAVTDFLDYSNTNKYKTTREINGQENNSVGGKIQMFSGTWRNTNAISSIRITTYTSGGKFLQYSSFALYGIKGA